MNILEKIKGFRFLNISLDRWFGLALIAGLLVTAFTQCNGKKELQTEVAELVEYEYKYNSLLEAVDSMVVEHKHFKENAPKGVVIEKEVIKEVENTERLERYWWRFTESEKRAAVLAVQLEKAREKNSQLSEEDFEKDGGALVEIVPLEDFMPEVLDTLYDSGEYFDLWIATHTYGHPIGIEYDVKVRNNILKVEVPGPTKNITKRNALDVSTGMIYFDSRRYYIPTTLGYSRDWWGIEGGPVWKNDFSGIEGGEIKVKAQIKF